MDTGGPGPPPPGPVTGQLLGCEPHADVAQLVEHHLAKVRVAGSNPVVRSTVLPGQGHNRGVFLWFQSGPLNPPWRVRGAWDFALLVPDRAFLVPPRGITVAFRPSSLSQFIGGNSTAQPALGS